MISARRRWAAGALIVVTGWLASPGAVPVYDGLANPDEPYRYVAPPAGATRTAEPTSAKADAVVRNGGNVQGISVQTAEVGPQVSVFLPQRALSTARGPIHITVTPEAPTGLPAGLTADGNAYAFAFTAPGGPVTLNLTYAAAATVYLRATNQRRPQPDIYYRPDAGAAWTPLKTVQVQLDSRVAGFRGAGEYVLVNVPKPAAEDGGTPLLPLVLVGVLVVLGAVVLVVRLRAAPETAE